MQARNINNLKGIDISHYEFENGNSLNFDDVVNQGYKVVITKATDGSYGNGMHDATLPMVVSECNKRNLAVAPFHFFRVWKNSTVDAQVQNFLDYIKGISFTARPVLDVESETICDGANYATVLAQVNDCKAKLEAALKIEVIIYINTDLLKNLPVGINNDRYWIADYRYSNAPGENEKSENWIGFQYSDKGNVSGVSAVDVDEFLVDMVAPAWNYGELPQPVSTPIPSPVPILAPISTPVPSPSDTTVLDHQKKLNRLGIRDMYGNSLVEDGQFGVKSASAIVNLERIMNLTVDSGVWGSQCDNAYISIVAKRQLKYIPVFNMKGFDVRYIQFRSSCGIDGIFGGQTKNAVMNLQRNLGFTGNDVDGIFGNISWGRLIG